MPLALPLGFHEWQPVVQAATLGLLTFVQEDVPTIGAALLASAGQLGWQAGFWGCFLGIWLGDALLYLLARGIGRPLLEQRWAARFFPTAAVARSEDWFAERGAWLLISSRFVPGTRLPTYLAAGFLRVPFPRFLLVTGLTVGVWTAVIFALARAFGNELTPWLAKWQGSGLAVLLIAVAAALFLRLGLQLGQAVSRHRLYRFGGERGLESAGALAGPAVLKAPRPLEPGAVLRTQVRVPLNRCRRLTTALLRWTRWEFWPAWLFYPPVVLWYVWLSVKYRGFTVPTAANPGIFSGGMVGESKLATLRDLMAHRPEYTAPARAIEGVTVAERLASVGERLNRGELAFPFIVKPDSGQRGLGVKLIRNSAQLEACLQQADAPRLVQRYAPGPHEAGVFYYRFPHEARGRIFAITEKDFPQLVGDGRSTVEELVWRDDRARFVAATYLKRLGPRSSEVLPAGATLRLVEAGNHAQGCIFRDGTERLRTPELEARLDEISRGVPGFFIGRYDLRYASEDELRAGTNFQIIELNGAASEATNIYDARNSLGAAYRTLFRQWELVFAIGAANRARGHQPDSPIILWRAWRHFQKLAATYPIAD